MSNTRLVEIDRIVLSDFLLTPDRTMQIRRMVEEELQRLLERDGLSDRLASAEVPHLEASAMSLGAPDTDTHLASVIAQAVARTLHDVT